MPPRFAASETFTFDGSAEVDGSFRIFGGQGTDTITGSQGNDLITGMLGADSLRGGGGNDTFIYRNGRGIHLRRPRHDPRFLERRPHQSRADRCDRRHGGDEAFTFIGSGGVQQHRRRASRHPVRAEAGPFRATSTATASPISSSSSPAIIRWSARTSCSNSGLRVARTIVRATRLKPRLSPNFLPDLSRSNIAFDCPRLVATARPLNSDDAAARIRRNHTQGRLVGASPIPSLSVARRRRAAEGAGRRRGAARLRRQGRDPDHALRLQGGDRPDVGRDGAGGRPRRRPGRRLCRRALRRSAVRQSAQRHLRAGRPGRRPPARRDGLPPRPRICRCASISSGGPAR